MVDANPRIFETVLDWLRRGQLPRGERLEADHSLLVAEARTWRLTALLAVLLRGTIDQAAMDIILQCSQSPGGVDMGIAGVTVKKGVTLKLTLLHGKVRLLAEGARLEGLHIVGVDSQHRLDLSSSEFQGASLKGASFKHVCFSHCNFSQASLDKAGFFFPRCSHGQLADNRPSSSESTTLYLSCPCRSLCRTVWWRRHVFGRAPCVRRTSLRAS